MGTPATSPLSSGGGWPTVEDTSLRNDTMSKKPRRSSLGCPETVKITVIL